MPGVKEKHLFLILMGEISSFFLKYQGLPSEKAMASHSSTLAWKIPWMEEPGRLQSMESLQVRRN